MSSFNIGRLSGRGPGGEEGREEQLHKTIMGATHFFWWGIGGCHGLGELENAVNPYMANYVGICGSMN